MFSWSCVGAGSDPVAGLGSGASSGTGTGSGASLGGGILSRSLIVNILLLRLLRIFSLASKNNLRLLRKDLFSIDFTPSSIFFNSFTT